MSLPVVSTLTAPEDRKEIALLKEVRTSLNPDADDLTKEEIKEAVKEQVLTTFIEKFPRVERRFVDPPIQLQNYGLISFVPAKGATPNEKGVFGFAKLRGNFATAEEASLHARELVKKHDSYHKIYTTFVGRPFPITLSSNYSKEVDEVQLNKEIENTYNADVKTKREKELKEMKEIQEREKNLTAEIKRETDDPLEHYTTIQVKRANLIWTLKKTIDKIEEMKKSLKETRAEIATMDEEDSELKKNYFQKFMEARKKVGMTEEQHADNFIKYMVEDLETELGF